MAGIRSVLNTTLKVETAEALAKFLTKTGFRRPDIVDKAILEYIQNHKDSNKNEKH